MAEINLKNIYKRFDSFTAVRNLSIDVKDKEFLVLLGPSGCGKTTTLRCISGLEKPSEGKIILGGEDVTQKRASERDIAFVFQLYALYPHLTAYENIAFPLKSQRLPSGKIKEEVMRTAEMLKITGILNKKPKALSGGDHQRIALGRALVRRPKAFLLDEPIGTLDAAFREEMRTELKRLHVDNNATSVYVTHDQVEAMSMGDRIAVMNNAELQQIGTPHDVYSNPKNLFVANFIGSPGMNFIHCELIRTQEGISLKMKTDGSEIVLKNGLARIVDEKNYFGKPLILGVRPEDIFLCDQKEKDTIPTEVFVREKMGSYDIIDVKFGEEIIRVRTLPGKKVETGENVFISFNMDRIRLFDKESEQAITE